MSERTRIEVALLLPALPDSRDACVKRLTDLLAAKEGVASAHLAESEKSQPDQICIHYDPARLSLAEIRELAKRAGAEIESRFGHLVMTLAPMYARRARTLEEGLRQITGVVEAVASPSGTIRIEFDRHLVDEPRLRAELQKVGGKITEEQQPDMREPVGARKTPQSDDHHSHSGLFGERTELLFAGLSGALLTVGWLSSAVDILPATAWYLYVAAYFFGGYFTFKEAIGSVRAGRFEIEFLMLAAAIGAAILGEWAEGALLLFLFSLGHALEHYAMGRAKRAIEALAELAPQTALVRRADSIAEVRVESLVIGDCVIVKPNAKIPADGFVTKGESSVNQAPITGESVPVDKAPVADPQKAADNPDRLDSSHRVFTGTINGSGALEIQVTKLSKESTLARVVAMVNEAETQKSPTQRFTDRFERYFVPAVLAIVALSLFAWVIIDEPFSQSFYRAMAVLVAASPCALAISTPSAVLSGIARAARGGVLVKGGGPLENLGVIRSVAFDKTGTLTEGKPRLVDVVASGDATEGELLQVAVAVEELSDHPLAAAVVRGAAARAGSDNTRVHAQGLKSITGRGVSATFDGTLVHVGKSDLFTEIDGPRLPNDLREQVQALERNGRTTMIVRSGDRYLGALGLMDTPREAAKAMIAKLRALGIERMIMISGDNQHVADAIAKEVGIDEAWGDLMPDDKVASIKKLRNVQPVAMVGDGVNDAPAMANATVGIAMGAAGSDVALETADVALMADDLNHLPFAIGLSRRTRQVIRQNLWVSLGMVAFLIPATILGLRIAPTVALHEGSTLLVVFNALRLLAYRSP